MEGMRGFAVFLVFLVHYVTLMAPWINQQSPLHEVSEFIHTLGNAGVDLFFVLSGYLIYGSLIARPQGFMRFMRRRIARIYPAFCVVFALYLLLSFAFPLESKLPKDAVEVWKYVFQNFLLLPGLLPITPIIAVAWSLSYEMFYYLVLPVLIVLLRLRHQSRAWRMSTFAVIAVSIAVYCAINTGPVRLIMFIAGILLYEVMREGAIAVPRDGMALAALIAALIATTAPYPGSLAYTLKIVTLFFAFSILCYTCFTRNASWLAKGFSWTPLRWLGNMSYSYYLLHGLSLKIAFAILQKIVADVGNEPLFFAGMLPVMFVVTLLPAAGLFLLIERPFSLAGKPSEKLGAAPALLSQ